MALSATFLQVLPGLGLGSCPPGTQGTGSRVLARELMRSFYAIFLS